VKRRECLEWLATFVPEDTVVAASLSSNSSMWSSLRPQGANFFGLNLGLSVPFAVGLTLAFPKTKVLCLESDGSLMNDSSSLITLADVNPSNLVVLVFDNASYARMGPTFTARAADLEKIAQGAGVRNTATVKSQEEFALGVKRAFESEGLAFIVVKVEPDTERTVGNPRFYGRPMRERFVDTILKRPDYWGKRGAK
jgi:thiamine pyrophosphate-dependent acetolactate synthase large subunit-like protein